MSAMSTLAPGQDVQDNVPDSEFDLDVKVFEAAAPAAARLRCDTSDGCGSTCSGSACNSNAYLPS